MPDNAAPRTPGLEERIATLREIAKGFAKIGVNGDARFMNETADELERLAGAALAEREGLREQVEAVLNGYRLSYATDEDGGPLALVDVLSVNGDTIVSGQSEIRILADDISAALTPEQGEPDLGIEDEAADDEGVRCTCEWQSPEDGEVHARWPAETDWRCGVHGRKEAEREAWPEGPPADAPPAPGETRERECCRPLPLPTGMAFCQREANHYGPHRFGFVMKESEVAQMEQPAAPTSEAARLADRLEEYAATVERTDELSPGTVEEVVALEEDLRAAARLLRGERALNP